MADVGEGVTLADILARCDPPARRNDRGWMAHCPAHRDSSPSLSLAEGPHGVLVHCFAGCTRREVLEAFGEPLSVTPASTPEEPSAAWPAWQLAVWELERQALRRHAKWWLPEDGRLLVNTEILADHLRRQASILQAVATFMPPDLESTWNMVERASNLEHEARLLEAAAE